MPAGHTRRTGAGNGTLVPVHRNIGGTFVPGLSATPRPIRNQPRLAQRLLLSPGRTGCDG